MPDSFRVAIVAQSPDPNDPNKYPPDAGHELTVTKLSSVPTGPKVSRARHVEELWQRIDEALKDPARGIDQKLDLQIIGHGGSGLLHLGSSWMEEQLEVVYADPFYCLDTNPRSLAFLSEFKGRFDRISLVACRVGVGEDGGYVANGRTLVYTLCEILQTKVFGAMDDTDPTEYDPATGDYLPAANRLLPSSWRWVSVTEPPVYDNPNSTAEPSLVRVAGSQTTFRMRRLRSLIHARSRGVPIETDVELVVTRIDDRRLLAAARELRVMLSVDGQDVAADMFGNGRVLRIGSDLYAVENHATVARAIGALLSRPPLAREPA